MLLPEHMMRQKRLHAALLGCALVVGLILSGLIAALYPLINWIGDKPLNIDMWATTKPFLTDIMTSPTKLKTVHLREIQANWTDVVTHYAFSVTILFLIAIMAHNLSPFARLNQIYGDSRFGDAKTLKEMEEKGRAGIENGRHLILGRLPTTLGLRRNKYVRMIESLSGLLLAPPGTGKTSGFIVPSLIESNDCSFVVNDPKPELFDMTSNHRDSIGYVYKMDWSQLDDPDRGIFYPRMNFLDPEDIPVDPAARDTRFDAIAKILIPDKKGSGNDSYFNDAGREALTGFIHFLYCKIADHKNYNGIPDAWVGKPPSLPMLVNFIAAGKTKAAKEAKAAKESAQKENSFYQGDPEANWILGLVQEAEDGGYSQRAINALGTLPTMADKQRSGVLGVVEKSLIPFQNTAVQQRCSDSDIKPSQLRGIKDEETGEWKPVTLYICVNQAEAEAFASITALLFETISLELTAYGPGEINRRGVELGPFDVGLALDEFPTIPATERLVKGPDLGRSKGTFYMFVAQDFSQIEKNYTQQDIEILITTTGFKIILPQNNDKTAERLQKMVGKTTIEKVGETHQGGLVSPIERLKVSKQASTEGVDLLRMNDITSMPKGTQIVLFQDFMNRPLRLEIPFFFKDPTLKPKVYNIKTKLGPKPAPPLSAALHAARHAQLHAEEAERAKIIDFLREKEKRQKHLASLRKDEPQDDISTPGAQQYNQTEARITLTKAAV